MFKNERHIINEWLDHHISVGFDHIYLIDNMSSDNYIIDDKFKKFVTIYKSEIRQQDVYNKYLPTIKKTSDWVACIDLDEFLYSKEYSNIKKLLSGIPNNISRIDIQMKNFCVSHFNNQISKIESQTHYMPDSVEHPKCISRTNNLIKLNIHNSISKINNRILFNHDSHKLCINHYRYQSIEYLYGIKEQRGGGVHKNKYKEQKVLSAGFKTQSSIEDLWLKKNSSTIIKNCYKRNDPGPNTSLYSNSSWEQNSPHIIAHKEALVNSAVG